MTTGATMQARQSARHVALLIEESSLGATGAQKLRRRTPAPTITQIKVRAYLSDKDPGWWNDHHHDADALFGKACDVAGDSWEISELLLRMAADRGQPNARRALGERTGFRPQEKDQRGGHDACQLPQAGSDRLRSLDSAAADADAADAEAAHTGAAHRELGDVLDAPPTTVDALPVDSWDADQAVTALYSAHYSSLVRLAALLVHDVGTAEEIVQDAFVAMHGGWRRLRVPEKAVSYLRQSVVNRSRSVLRHRAVVQKYRPDEWRHAQSAEDDTIVHLERSAVVQALASLPTRQREALVLRYYADLSVPEIARTMGIGRSTAASHVTRGIAALRHLTAGSDSGRLTG